MLGWRPLAMVVLSAALALAGCTDDGGDELLPTTSTTVQLKDACSLLRPASIEQVIGRPVRPGAPADSDAARSCVFDTSDGTGTVTVRLETGSDAAFDQLREAYPDAAEVTLRADEAFWSDRLHTLVARDGQTVVTISLNMRNAPADQLPWAVDLADEALSAL